MRIFRVVGLTTVVTLVFLLDVLVAKNNNNRSPMACIPTEVGKSDECKDFAPKGHAHTECLDGLKGDPDYLQICTFTRGLKSNQGRQTSTPVPNKNCRKVACDHPCYVPCVYFIARNRTFKAEPTNEVRLTGGVTYACTNDAGDLICGCSSVVDQQV